MRVFYWLGQTLYPLDFYLCERRRELSRWHRFTMMMPTIVMFTVKLVLCVASITLVNLYGDVINITYDIMTDIFLFCEIAKIFAVIYQNFAHSDLIGEILRNFQSVESLFRSSLQSPIQFSSFECVYTKKIRWAFGSYLVLLMLFISYYFLFDDIDWYDVFIEIMQFVSISMYFHVLLFIDLVAFNLKHLNEIIANDNNEYVASNVSVFVVQKPRTPDLIRQRMSKYKFIHFRLWRTAQHINEFFGWMLITILLQSFVEFVYNTIWQLKILYDFWNFVRFSRKKS